MSAPKITFSWRGVMFFKNSFLESMAKKITITHRIIAMGRKKERLVSPTSQNEKRASGERIIAERERLFIPWDEARVVKIKKSNENAKRKRSHAMSGELMADFMSGLLRDADAMKLIMTSPSPIMKARCPREMPLIISCNFLLTALQ